VLVPPYTNHCHFFAFFPRLVRLTDVSKLNANAATNADLIKTLHQYLVELA